MTRDDCLAWTARYVRSGAAANAALAAALDQLASTAPRAPGAVRAFQLALNDRDRFSLVKVVDVADGDAPPEARPAGAGAARREAVRAILERAGDAARVARLDDLGHALDDAGLGDHFPTVGIELDPRDGSCPEASLYTERSPAEVAACVARAVLGRDADAIASVGPLFASGFDLLPGGRVRLKLYTRASVDAVAASDVLRPLAALPVRGVLALRRGALDGELVLDDVAKLYAHLGDLPAAELIAARPTGRLGAMLAWAADALEGTRIAFVSAGGDKTELYFERSGAE